MWKSSTFNVKTAFVFNAPSEIHYRDISQEQNIKILFMLLINIINRAIHIGYIIISFKRGTISFNGEQRNKDICIDQKSQIERIIITNNKLIIQCI